MAFIGEFGGRLPNGYFRRNQFYECGQKFNSAFKKFRKMKVYNVSGYNYKDTPTIILKGDWLKETGFDIRKFKNL